MASCLICGCVRNSGRYLEDVFKNIERIRGIFDKTKIIVSYDESMDASLLRLVEFKQRLDDADTTKDDTVMDIIVNRDPITDCRTVNIERARNKILDKIYGEYADYDYFIMLDMDDVSAKPINIEVLERALERDQEWDGLFFNNENYYDFWALSIGDYQYSCWHSNDGKRIINAMNRDLRDRFKALEEGRYLECESAFGGFGIYKIPKFRDCRYRSRIDLTHFNTPEMMERFNKIYSTLGTRYIINDNVDDCEHRYFHMNAIRKNGVRLLISPEHLFPPYTGEHLVTIEKI